MRAPAAGSNVRALVRGCGPIDGPSPGSSSSIFSGAAPAPARAQQRRVRLSAPPARPQNLNELALLYGAHGPPTPLHTSHQPPPRNTGAEEQTKPAEISLSWAAEQCVTGAKKRDKRRHGLAVKRDAVEGKRGQWGGGRGVGLGRSEPNQANSSQFVPMESRMCPLFPPR